jgi:UPF0755 protein
MRYVLISAAVVLLITVLAVVQSFALYTRATLRSEPTVLVIAPGTGSKAILAQLHAAGLMPPLWQIAVPIYLHGEYRGLKAGEYQFEASQSPEEILQQIAKGRVLIRKLTIPEGWNVRQVREALLAEPALTGTLPPTIAEGSILPETYHFTRGQVRSELLAKMQQDMNVTITELWNKRQANLPIATPAEALILASIVERETGIAHERPRVAAVFINRLRLPMRLQSDPTAMYGIEQASGQALGRTPTAADIATDSPWNTYTRDGLPPTPICNPGRDASAAVLNPPQTRELYFVATGDGGHFFAETLAEHNRNVVRYRHALKQAKTAP